MGLLNCLMFGGNDCGIGDKICWLCCFAHGYLACEIAAEDVGIRVYFGQDTR